MWPRKNDLSYLGNNLCPRSHPYKYKYSYLLRRCNLHCFRKDQGNSRRYLKKRNKCWKIYNLHSKSRVYIQNLFVYEEKTTSNFVLESLNFFFMRSHSSTIIIKIIVPENKDNYWTWQHFPSKSRLYSCKMWNSFSGRKWTHSNMVVDHWMSS